MEAIPYGGDADRRQENEIARLFDAPAYIRRARAVEQALEALLVRGRSQRDEWLAMPRLRLGQLRARAGDWSALVSHLADHAALDTLRWLEEHLTPRLRVPLAATTSPRVLRAALDELIDALELFNARWRRWLDGADLIAVNQLREGYNRYYVLEKSCALRSDRIARQGFQPLPPLDREELQQHLPLLPVPRRAGK